MKICNNCKSDVIDSTSYVGLKVILCLLIFFFIPFGFFLFWLPLLIPSSHQCEKCESNDIIEMDWREFEAIKDEIKVQFPEPLPQPPQERSPYTFDVDEKNN